MDKDTARFQARRRGFTLLEMMMAVAILALIGLTIYQFTDVTLQSARFSAQVGDEEAVRAGLRRLLETQLAELPFGTQGALLGYTVRGRSGGRGSDSLQLVCPPGNGVLTTETKVLYEVTFFVREMPTGSGKFALGMERQAHEDDEEEEEEVVQMNNGREEGRPPNNSLSSTAVSTRPKLPSDWIKLMDDVNRLELGYFDSRLNGWVEKWTDQSVLPSLVRFRLFNATNQPPYELVVRVPAGGVRRDATTFTPIPPRPPGAGAGTGAAPNGPRITPLPNQPSTGRNQIQR
jgi:prepilin-type N-terminal cleavage/methylation domain-containing protein